MKITTAPARITITRTVVETVTLEQLILWLRREVGAERIDPTADVDTLDEELTWFLEDHFSHDALTAENRTALLAWVKELARHKLPQVAEEFRRGESVRG